MSTTKWALDPSHSEIQFKAKHLMITNVTGTFANVNGTAETQGDDFANAKISFAAQVNSINTGSEQRDGHLKSADFFDAEKHPEIKFEGTKFERKDGNDYTLHGNLTIKDVTKPVKLDVEYSGTQKDPWGNTKAGFSLHGKINRTDWGLTWNSALETGGVLVSEEIKILGEIQLAKQA